MKLASFDAKTGEIERIFKLDSSSDSSTSPSVSYVSVSVSRNGEYVYAANERDALLRCWRVNDGKLVSEIQTLEDNNACIACATHPYGNAVVTLTSPNVCKLFTA